MIVATVSLIKYSASTTEYDKLLSFSGLMEFIHTDVAIFSHLSEANHIIQEMEYSVNVGVMN